jgi:nucleoid-associated protein YgaU
MPPPDGFQKAKLAIDGGDTIECMFNPSTYSVTKTNIWNYKPSTGVDLPDGEFGGGLPQQIKLQLLLDQSVTNQSIKDQADKLFKMMESGGGGGGGGAPSKVTFQWGAVNLPKAVPVSLTVQFVLFQPNGEPIRAHVDLELAQSEKAQAGQNPTTRAIGGIHVHTVRDGDSLQSIAFENYGDPTRWRTIAEANGIDDPMRLRRGGQLNIPRLES